MPFDRHGRFIWNNSSAGPERGGVDQVNDDFDMTPLIRTRVFDTQDNDVDKKGQEKRSSSSTTNTHNTKYQDHRHHNLIEDKTGPSKSNNDYSDRFGHHGASNSNGKSSSCKDQNNDQYNDHRYNPIKDSTSTEPSRSNCGYDSERFDHHGTTNAHGYDSYDNFQYHHQQENMFESSTSMSNPSQFNQTLASGHEHDSSTNYHQGQGQTFHDNDNYNFIHFGQSEPEQLQIQNPMVFSSNQIEQTQTSASVHGHLSSTFHDDDNYNFNHFIQPESQIQKPMDMDYNLNQNVEYKRRRPAPPAPVLSAQNFHQTTLNSSQKTKEYRQTAQTEIVKSHGHDSIETENYNYNYNQPKSSRPSSSSKQDLYDPVSAHFDDHGSSPPGSSSSNKYKPKPESHGYGYEEPEENVIDILASTYCRPFTFTGQPKYKKDEKQTKSKPEPIPQNKNEITERPKSILKKNHNYDQETIKASTTETRAKKPSASAYLQMSSNSNSTLFKEVKEAKSKPIVPYKDKETDIIEIKNLPSPSPRSKRNKIDIDLKLYCDLFLYDKLLIQLQVPTKKQKQNHYPNKIPRDCMEVSINEDFIKIKLSKLNKPVVSKKKNISQLVNSWSIYPILELPLDCIKKVKIVFVDSRTRFTLTFFQFLTDEPTIAKIKENLRKASANLEEDQVESSKYFSIYSNSIGDKEIEKFKTIFGNHNVIVDSNYKYLSPKFGQHQYLQCYCKSIKFGTISLCTPTEPGRDSPYIFNIIHKPNGPEILVRIIESQMSRVKEPINCKISFPYDKRNKYYLMHLGASSWIFYFLLYNADDVIPELESNLKNDNVAEHFNPNSSDPKKVYISFIVKYTANILERKEKAFSAIEAIFDNYTNFIGPPPNSIDIFENQEKECRDRDIFSS